MSFLNKNFSDKPSLVKPIAVIVAILLIVGGAFTFFGSKKNFEKEPNLLNENGERLTINSSGLDEDDNVEDVGDVEKVIAKWIEANPQAILQSVSNMQRKAMEDRMKDAQKNISTKKDDLFDNKSPQYAPAGYDVTVVEFFDYNCGYCKQANATVEQLLKEDKKVRVIYKDFPILGEPSNQLSQVSIAVHLIDPSAYREFHEALMKSKERDKAGAIRVAKSVGINVAKLEEVLKKDADKISKILQDNIALGASIGIQGTPGFVIGEELVPGALEIGAFREKIAAARTK
jgi:protein-disulfide isomerase